MNSEAQKKKHRDYQRRWREAHPDYQRQWAAAHPSYHRAWSAAHSGDPKRVQWRERYRAEGKQRSNDYRRLYGISIDDYDAMLTKQGAGCAICGIDNPGRGRSKRFHVDHDHVTGKVRGLLCIACNVHLGWLERRRLAVEDYLK